MKKKPSIVCLGVRDNEADMGRIVTKGRRQKEMLRNKEASCPPSLFLVFSLSLFIFLSSLRLISRKGKQASPLHSHLFIFSSLPSETLIVSDPRTHASSSPANNFHHSQSWSLPSESQVSDSQQENLSTRNEKKKQSSAMVHGNAYKKLGRVVDGRIRKDWPTQHPFGPPRSAWSQTKGLETTGLQCWRNAMLQCLLHVPEFFHYLSRAERCEERSCQGPKRTGVPCVYCALRERHCITGRLPARASG